MSAHSAHSSGDVRPVAMIRGGSNSCWRLHDAPGPEWPGEFTEPEPLARFYGHDFRAQAQAWCDEHGYYLSSYSDGDDRR